MGTMADRRRAFQRQLEEEGIAVEAYRAFQAALQQLDVNLHYHRNDVWIFGTFAPPSEGAKYITYKIHTSRLGEIMEKAPAAVKQAIQSGDILKW